jgi:hypothetical protein
MPGAPSPTSRRLPSGRKVQDTSQMEKQDLFSVENQMERLPG